MKDHLAELQLRRLFAGELLGEGAEQARRHASECGACRARLRGIEDEQARFEGEISLERFKAGVERAGRLRHAARPPPGVMLLAAAAMIAVFALPTYMVATGGSPNRLKGSTAVDLYISAGGTGPQRTASATTPELLSPGDRVRIAYKAGDHRFVAAVSVDEQGETSALYPQSGMSIRVEDGNVTSLFPDSLEFTGKGAETVVVVFSDGPLDVSDLTRAAKEAYERAGGDVQRLPELHVPGLQLEQLRRTVLKP